MNKEEIKIICLKQLTYTVISLVYICFFFSSVFANTLHGLSLYGPKNLKYKHGQSYEYSNPNAPKGGHLVLADFGAFIQTPMDSSADDSEPFSQYGKFSRKSRIGR